MTTSTPLIALAGLSSLQRPRFSPGLLLEDEDLTAGVDYTRELVQLLFRSLFGCGVICGLDVEATLICNGRKLQILVRAGLGLDCMGNPIQLSSDQTLVYDPDCVVMPGTIWVTACYVERSCRPKEVCTADDDGGRVYTRSRGGWEIRLYQSWPRDTCSCEPEPKTNTGDEKCCTPAKDPSPVPAGSAYELQDADACACYDDHNRGKCSCACGCGCIVLGRIRTDKVWKAPAAPKPLEKNAEGGEPPPADAAAAEQVDEKRRQVDDVARHIRPVLTGYLRCLTDKIEHPKKAEDGAA
jgi:hypothetical protein